MGKKIFTYLKNKSAFYFGNKSLPERKQALYLAYIFAAAFALRLLIFYNTTVFAFSDFVIYYSGAFKVATGEVLPLFSQSSPLIISFIGAWFIKNLGSINYWFYANILISSLSLPLLWAITKKITRHSGIANLSILILAFYPTFFVQPSIFYTQVVMIFIASGIILLLLTAYGTRNNLIASVCIILSSGLIVISMFFKWELLYFHIFIGVSSIYLFLLKYKRQALISLLFGILTFVFLQLTIQFFEPIQTYLKNGDNNLLFFGQTPYSGSEGIMLDSYREKYEQGLEEFKRLHESEYENQVMLKNAYQSMLIKDFILNHPHEWAGLQAKKFFRTLGVKPEGMSFRLLVSGKIPLGKNIAGILLSVPFVFLFLCCIFLFDKSLIKKLFQSYTGIFIITVFVYYIIATIFYPHYQIRYRMPLEFFFVCPAAAAFIISSLSGGNTLKQTIKKHLLIKVVVFIIFASAWVYETYDIFVLNKDRYIKNAEKYEEGFIP